MENRKRGVIFQKSIKQGGKRKPFFFVLNSDQKEESNLNAERERDSEDSDHSIPSVISKSSEKNSQSGLPLTHLHLFLKQLFIKSQTENCDKGHRDKTVSPLPLRCPQPKS